jgi:hypothetical protein
MQLILEAVTRRNANDGSGKTVRDVEMIDRESSIPMHGLPNSKDGFIGTV